MRPVEQFFLKKGVKYYSLGHDVHGSFISSKKHTTKIKPIEFLDRNQTKLEFSFYNPVNLSVTYWCYSKDYLSTTMRVKKTSPRRR